MKRAERPLRSARCRHAASSAPAVYLGPDGSVKQRFGVTAPQMALDGHSPQSSTSLQPSEIAPHSAPRASQVVGTQEGGGSQRCA